MNNSWKTTYPVAAMLLILVWAAPALAESPIVIGGKYQTVPAGWREVQTRFTVIRYPSPQILDTFQRSIEYGSGWWASGSSYARFTEEETIKIVRLKVDAVFKRVQEILDMRKAMKKVVIMVYPDEAALAKAFQDTYRSENHFRAWYEFRTNTISMNAQDCHEGMLAHELAHSIIDNFLEIRPPKNTAEILARYVDSHLK